MESAHKYVHVVSTDLANKYQNTVGIATST